jgi:hypothetical protein
MAARILSIAGHMILALLVALTAFWGTLALWYRLPFGEIARYAVPALWILLALIALRASAFSRWRQLIPYVVALVALLVWWQTIEPRSDKDWAPDVARQFTATIDGHTAGISDVRNFDWRSDQDFGERWEKRNYDLDAITSVDIINSYWSGPAIAHTLLSFGFADGRYLTFSIEVRRRRGEVYSEVSGFFKEDELVIIAADERDIIRVRSNVRGEDVQLFRLRVTPEQARAMFLALAAEANDLAAKPRFYNTVTANCTTILFGLARQISPTLPLDWRVLLSGHLPDYLYRIGVLDQAVPLAELREKGRINERAKAADQSTDFSRAIREGVPEP